MSGKVFYCNVFVYETVASIVKIAVLKQMCHSSHRAVNVVLGHGSSRFKKVTITVLTMKRGNIVFAC